jgi:hypothetical protein
VSVPCRVTPALQLVKLAASDHSSQIKESPLTMCCTSCGCERRCASVDSSTTGMTTTRCRILPSRLLLKHYLEQHLLFWKPSGSIFMREVNRRFTLLLQTITPGAILPPTSTARSHQAPAADGDLFGSLLRMFIDHFGALHNPLPACLPPLRPAASVQSLGTVNS